MCNMHVYNAVTGLKAVEFKCIGAGAYHSTAVSGKYVEHVSLVA